MLLYLGCYLHPGAALPAKKTARGLTFLRSCGVMDFNVKYLCRLKQKIFRAAETASALTTYMDHTKDIQGLTL
jgi:hypothetical protein